MKTKALKNDARSFEVTIINNRDPSIQLADTKKVLEEKFRELLDKRGGYKFNITLKVKLSKETGDGKIYKEPYFTSSTMTVLNNNEIGSQIDLAIENILEGIAVWLSEGSGWKIVEILNHYVNIFRYLPLRGKSYIALPKELRNSKKGLINLKNEDNQCFRWCHVRYLNPRKVHPERITMSDKKFVRSLDYSGVTFPLKIGNIKKIEVQNSININVFGCDNGRIYPIRISSERYNDHMEVLYIEGEGKETYLSTPLLKSHYVYIKDFNSLMFTFTKHKERKHFCMHCLQCFRTNDKLIKHLKDCLLINGTQAIEMPVEGSTIHFNNHHKMQPVPVAFMLILKLLQKR